MRRNLSLETGMTPLHAAALNLHVEVRKVFMHPGGDFLQNAH